MAWMADAANEEASDDDSEYGPYISFDTPLIQFPARLSQQLKTREPEENVLYVCPPGNPSCKKDFR